MRKIPILAIMAWQLISLPALAEQVPEYVYIPWEIHNDHDNTLWGVPAMLPSDNDLIFRKAYTLLSNDETKFADWVSFKLSKEMMGGPTRDRKWQTDPWLESYETLAFPSKSKDEMLGLYEEMNGKPTANSYDRGHQANLSAFSNTPYWAETNIYSNITPQKSWLNQGIWEELESRIKEIATRRGPVWVFTGPLYYDQLQAFEQTELFQRHKAYVEANAGWRDNPNFANGALNYSPQPSLPNTQKEHELPAGYWKVMVIPNFEDPKASFCATFIFGQDTPQVETIMPYIYNIDSVEQAAGIDLLWQLDDEVEDQLERWFFNDSIEAEDGLVRRYRN